MIAAELQNVTEADLSALIAIRRPESQTIDYKRDTYTADQRGRHDLCADVSALANSSGGDLIIGIDEDPNGCALAITPIVGNPDAEQRRLLDVLANGVEPKIPGLRIRAVDVAGGFVIVIRVPQSWTAPHRVLTNQHFFAREGARKRQLDMPEIRSAFLRSSGLAERLSSFRAERLGRIVAGETPLKLRAGVPTVLHVFPLLNRDVSIDPNAYDNGPHSLPVISGNALSYRINLDGVVAFRDAGGEGSGAYTQFYRDGRVEAVRIFTNPADGGRINIPSRAFERELLDFYRRMTAEMRRLELGPPFALTYSILRARSAVLGVGPEFAMAGIGEFSTFDRDTVLIPDLVVNEQREPEQDLRPMFDLIWQSAGLARSLNYRDDGVYRFPQG